MSVGPVSAVRQRPPRRRRRWPRIAALVAGAVLLFAAGVALGALATIFVLVRVISVPDDFFFAHRGAGLWISLAAALAVIVAGLLQASEEM